MLKKRKYKKRKTKVKFYICEKLRCQGRKEVRYIKECIRYKRTLPTKPKRIETPFGYYTPDFEFPDRFIEIKSLHTLKVSLGLVAYKGIGEPSDKQFTKIQWVSINVKPIEIICYLGLREKKVEFNIATKEIIINFKGGYKPKKKKLLF